MSIQTTVTLNRTVAINRIIRMEFLIQSKDYVNIQQKTFEPDESINELINNHKNLDLPNIENWTNEILEEILDKPFYRQSLFENYRVVNDIF